MLNIPSFLTFARSLSFAGLLSAGIGAVIYFFLFPQLFVGIVSAKIFIIFCGLLGAGLQQMISGFFSNVLTPVGKYILYYEKLLELTVLHKQGIISEEKFTQLVDRLTDERFIGSLPTTQLSIASQLPATKKPIHKVR
ncbi:MAG: hypothetical protein LC803_02165 [Acidobacteria bacterium]|nr:hypothetical protein [Acidobacteriota bacterium]